MERWTDDEYEAIFRGRPPTEPEAPSAEETERLADELGRSAGAIRAQWDDARSLVLGQRNAASAALRDYLTRRGWLWPDRR
jgi:hypothetical protein